MNSKTILGAGFALLITSIGATASSVPLDVSNNYDFQLAGGGGSAVANLNGVSYQIFCDNFANDINLGTDYSAYVTVLSTTANLSETRFGAVTPSDTSSTGWEAITLNTGSTSVDSADQAFFDSGAGLSSLARYEMVAYLVSNYNLSQGNSNSNNAIQEAIWTLMDPAAEGPAENPSGQNPSSYLESAATWYVGMNTGATNLAALNAFLSNYDVVSDSTMSFATNGPATGGYQEQIIDPSSVPAPHPVPTPEPRGIVGILGALVAASVVLARRNRVPATA
jgi:hypothetical protein